MSSGTRTTAYLATDKCSTLPGRVQIIAYASADVDVISTAGVSSHAPVLGADKSRSSSSMLRAEIHAYHFHDKQHPNLVHI